ncbi:MAG: PAS domain S-box protein [Cyanobacteria bacterium J06626_18]
MLKDDANNELHTQIQYRLLEKLTESERRYRELVENLREIVSECNPEGYLSFVNRAWPETLGYPATEVIGKRLSDFVNPEDDERLNSALLGHAECGLELRIYHQSGHALWLELALRSGSNGKLSFLHD